MPVARGDETREEKERPAMGNGVARRGEGGGKNPHNRLKIRSRRIADASDFVTRGPDRKQGSFEGLNRRETFDRRGRGY